MRLNKKVHSEAHKLEHELSEEVTDKLEDFLKKPKVCPDGNPIPAKDTRISELDKSPANRKLRVLFAKTSNSETLERLNSLGIVPNSELKIKRRIKKGPLVLSVKGSEVALGSDICSKIFVEII